MPAALARRPDWELRLRDYLQARSGEAFAWGRHDCVLFALGAAAAVTGVAGPVAQLRGRYGSARGAARVMRRHYGAGDLEAAAAAFARAWRIAEVPVLMAQRGDIVLADVFFEAIGGASGPALGVVGLDGRYAIFASPRGYERIKLRDCRKAWRIG